MMLSTSSIATVSREPREVDRRLLGGVCRAAVAKLEAECRSREKVKLSEINHVITAHARSRVSVRVNNYTCTVSLEQFWKRSR